MPPVRPVPAFGDRSSLRVGLLGGSFNPAHHGHLHISEAALRMLGLDQLWWMVSPQNPLKAKTSMAPLEKRLSYARCVACHPKIRVSGLEIQLGTRYSVDSLRALKMRYPNMTFIWLMGADNLAGCHQWKNWDRLFAENAIVIFHRPAYSLNALRSKAAHRFSNARRPVRSLRVIRRTTAPLWGFVPLRGRSVSATQLRRKNPNWADATRL